MTNHHAKTQTEEIIAGTHGRTYVIDDAGVAHRVIEDAHICDSEWCCMTDEEMAAQQEHMVRCELASGHVHGGGNPEDAWTAAGQTMELRRLDREAQEQAHREFAIMDRIYTERGMEF